MTKKLLLVDDEKDVVAVLKAALEPKGYEVLEAYDGLEALRKIEEHKPDLIILDILIPKLDGGAVNTKLKADPKTADIPVIIITGKGNSKELSKLKEELKVSEYLEKPFKVAFLIKRIQEILL